MVLILIIAFLSVIVLMIVHEFGHFIIAKRCGVEVKEFGIGYPPRLFGKKIGKTLYSVNLIPLGAFVKIPGEIGGLEDYNSFSNLPIYKRVLIVLGGVLSFWIIAALLFIITFNIGVSAPIDDQADVPNAKVQIYQVASGSPADLAGIKKGDVIKRVEATQISKVKDFQDAASLYKGKQITIAIQRNNDYMEFSLIPRISPPANEGAVGLQLERVATLIEKVAWYEAPVKGIVFCGDITIKLTKGLADLLIGLFSGKGLPQGAEPAGPVGIMVFLAQAASLGTGFFLYFIAAIAVLLAISNLLPIPALDGGKILFLIIEKIRSKPVSEKVENIVTLTFFFLLIGFSLFVTIKFDIPKLYQFIRGS